MSEYLVGLGSNLSQAINAFRDQYGLHKVIAISGGADVDLQGVPPDDPLQVQHKQFSEALEKRVIGDAIGMFRGYRIAILTGGTKWGAPKTATMKAKEYGLKTIGVYPVTGRKHALGGEFLDFEICVEPLVGESRWGDESPVFTNLLDGVIVYGGGAGTLTECAHILKINEAILKTGRSPLKYIVPIAGTGGVADGLPFIWAKPEVRAQCMPQQRVLSGTEAGKILRDVLNLDDYFEI